ncbi:MAG: DUF3526 domain-containing protein [Lewinella sp.]
MRLRIIQLFLKYTFADLTKRSGTKWMIGILNLLILFALATAYGNLRSQRSTIEDYRHEVRERWEANPDKHPHRMAHYGYVAFREPHPLSFFDRGLESYVGNAVFLEAHRQNTVNFSEASLSTGLLRFGELSGALVLQALLPLLLFFWGFSLIAGERDDGKLRLVFAQGVTWPEVLFGKAAGLFLASLLVLVPAIAIAVILLTMTAGPSEVLPSLLRFGLLVLGYGLYLYSLSLFAVWVSTVSANAKTALMSLIGCWLLFVLVLPKVSQVAGQVIYPAPSKIAFDRAVEQELLQRGDSHNPDDPYFGAIKDSLLAAYQVSTTKELPFNYGGYIMREGEKLSTETFRQHQDRLMTRYEQQHGLVRWTSLINPYIAIKYASMALAGSDFLAYRSFQEQAEGYRYDLAQAMNTLQVEHVSNHIATSADASAALSSQHWADFRDFDPHPVSLAGTLRAEWLSLLAVCLWAAGLTVMSLSIHKPSSII